MEEYLRAMIRGLEDKADCLKRLLDMTQQQAVLLKADSVDWDAFESLGQQKDDEVSRLNDLDDGFQAVYDKIREPLNERKEDYKAQIGRMQELIRGLTGDSSSLLAEEQRNKELLMNRLGQERKRIQQSRTSSRVASNYYNTMNRINYIDPQLMDKKK